MTLIFRSSYALQSVAGVTAAARVVLEAAEAGIGAFLIVSDEAMAGQDVIHAELARIGVKAKGRVVDQGVAATALAAMGPADVILLPGSAIVGAMDIKRLSAGEHGAVELQKDGVTIARRSSAADTAGWIAGGPPPPRGARIEAQSPQTIFLRPAAAATWAVVSRTGKPSDGLVSRYLNRPISQRVSAMLLGLPGLRPWHLTLLTLCCALGMFATLTLGSARSLAAGCLLYQLASIVDGLDGEVARATYRTSPEGAALDTGIDMATNLLFILGLTMGLARLRGALYARVGEFDFAGLFVGVVMMVILLRKGPGGGSFDVLKQVYARNATDRNARLVAAVTTLTSRDFFALGFAILGVCGASWMIPWIMAAGVALWLAIILSAAPALLGASANGSTRIARADPDIS